MQQHRRTLKAEKGTREKMISKISSGGVTVYTRCITKLHSWKIVKQFMLLTSLICYLSCKHSLGSAAVTERKVVSNILFPKTGDPFIRGSFSGSCAENGWVLSNFI